MGLLSFTIAMFCVGGFALSYYAVHVSNMKAKNEDYQATCDLDETIACSKAFSSKYSRGFGIVEDILGEDHFLNIPNSYGGLIFFPVMMVLGFIPSKMLAFVGVLISIASCLGSVYLVYVLFYVLEIICLVCMPVHFINLALFILFTMKWNSMNSTSGPTTTAPGKSPSGQAKGGKRKSKKEQ